VYVTYDGLSDSLGQSQVLPYILDLAKLGHQFELISFEKAGAKLALRQPIARNVRWTALRYHKSPTVPATAFDITQGAGTVALLAAIQQSDLVHVRSYVSATMALPWSALRKTPVLFDTRGLWPEEKLESGSWNPQGNLYRSTKKIERVLFRRADTVCVLTHSFREYLRHEYPFRNQVRASIHVIPTCVDLEHFSPTVEPDADLRTQVGEARVLTYAGSLGGFYLACEMARFYLHFRRFSPKSRFLLITRSDPSAIATELNAAGVGHELIVRQGTRENIPSLLRCAHAALAFDGRGFAGRGTAPTKLGEALACGLPVAATPVGDVERVLEGERAGVLVRSLDENTLGQAAVCLHALISAPRTQTEARSLATAWFDLGAATQGYDAIYQHMGDGTLTDSTWPPDRDS
jgi:glycosyltransferase involved in cell wall biosynthesis